MGDGWRGWYDFYSSPDGVRASTYHEMPAKEHQHCYDLDIWIRMPNGDVWVGTVYTCDSIMQGFDDGDLENNWKQLASFSDKSYIIVEAISEDSLPLIVEELVKSGEVYTAFQLVPDADDSDFEN